MKNLKKVKFKKGTVCYLSKVGMYGYWYPCHEYETVITNDVEAEHMSNWRNQKPYYAFKGLAGCVKTIGVDLADDQFVCVWFREKQILENMLKIEKGE